MLHILLGIVKKHHTILEEFCDSLDLEIIEDCINNKITLDNASDSLNKYIKKLSLIKNKIKVNKRNLKHTIESILKKEISEAIETLNKKKTNLISKYPKRKGPVCFQLDEKLKEHRIELQAYHGRSFIGNHANKYLKSEVINDIAKSIVRNTCRYTENQEIIEKAKSIASTMKHANLLYAKIHQNISHCQNISSQTTESIRSDIMSYLFFYRNRLEQKMFPKLHFLEDHCLEWIEMYGVGLGLHSEQGGEQLHKSIKFLEIQNRGIVSEKQRLVTVMRKHFAEACPHILSMIPKIRHRKKEN